MINWSDYPNFTEAEMRCHCGCGRADMNPEFMEILQRVRRFYSRPMPVTSGYRCPNFDQSIGGAGVHPTGNAADISVAGQLSFELLIAAVGMNIRGIGFKQHGPYDQRFMHLDTFTGPLRPRIWTYT